MVEQLGAGAQAHGECVPDNLRDRLLPSIVEQGTYADELWGIGSQDSGLGLWAWRPRLEEVGARIPSSYEDAWTAEEFEQILRDLKDAGYEHPLDPKFWYGSQGESFSYAFAPILWSAGAGLVDTEGEATADGVLNSPEAVAALETFQRWVQDGLVDRDAADDSNFLQKRAPIVDQPLDVCAVQGGSRRRPHAVAASRLRQRVAHRHGIVGVGVGELRDRRRRGDGGHRVPGQR
ncbi:MAG TPA: hypothetical protein VK923_15930 [Euzebyales bacterium]|nr:hypothetical protein [Euzebyales bacterium]